MSPTHRSAAPPQGRPAAAADDAPRAMHDWPAPSSPRTSSKAADEATPSTAANTLQPPPQRHLDEELTALVHPRGCLDEAAAAALPGGRFTIRFDAVVMPSGRISRATIAAPGQPEAALRCLQTQLESASLAPPIQDAPRHVAGQIQMEAKVLPPLPSGRP